MTAVGRIRFFLSFCSADPDTVEHRLICRSSRVISKRGTEGPSSKPLTCQSIVERRKLACGVQGGRDVISQGSQSLSERVLDGCPVGLVGVFIQEVPEVKSAEIEKALYRSL